ncbi:MAG: heparinase II/III family protein [Lentisphaerae bacterium]|nr:heparinase II/III family protein [Lentisphaerota bacterium]
MKVDIAHICRQEDALREALRTKDARTTPPAVRHETADQCLQGFIAFNYLGGKYIKVGRSGIAWSGPQEKNQEWPAQLNNFIWFPPLAQAYLDTGDDAYAQAAKGYITDWLNTHTSGEKWRKADYDGMLQVSVRLQIWLGTLRDFRGSAAYDDPFVERMLASCVQQLQYLSEHMSVVGNQRIAHAESLTTNAIRLAQFPESRRWQEVGVRTLNESFFRQVLPDGGHVERCPSYHEWMTHIFDTFWRLSRAFPELGLTMTREKVSAMYDYVLAATRPNGALNALHDCTGAHAGKRPENWREKRDRFCVDAGLPLALPLTSQNFPYAGQACWRSSWEEDAVYLTFDASSWGGCHGHAHFSRNSVQLHAFGRSLLVDPGTLSYDARHDIMRHGKATRSHNTITLNGWNQSEADPEVRFDRAEGYDLAVGHYTGGYWPGEYDWGFRDGHGPGIWADHHRILLWIRDRAVVVLDRLMHDSDNNKPLPLLESNWQFSQGELILDRERMTVETNHDDGNVLMCFPLCSEPGIALSVHAGEKTPLRGWLPGKGAFLPAPQVCCRVPVKTRWIDLATVIVPFRGGERPRLQAQAVSQPVGKLELIWDNGATDTIYWAHQLEFALNEIDDFHTDAALVHVCRNESGSVQQCLLVDGTYLDSSRSHSKGFKLVLLGKQ